MQGRLCGAPKRRRGRGRRRSRNRETVGGREEGCCMKATWEEEWREGSFWLCRQEAVVAGPFLWLEGRTER